MEGTPTENAGRHLSYFGLTVMILGGTLSGLTQTAMNTMLPAVSADFGVSVSVGQWLVTAFMLCMGIIMPTVAFLARRFDARSLYLFSVALFSSGTLVMAAAPTFAVLMIGRVLQGCATGVMLPLLQVVVFASFPVHKRGTIMGFVGLAFGFAPNIGPTIGGALQNAFGWRIFFWFLLVFATFLLILAWFTVGKADTTVDAGRKMDLPSILLSTMGFGGVLLGVANASNYGLGTASCLAPLAAGLIILVAFIRRQLSLEDPFLDLRVFAYRDMTAGTVAICLLFMSFIGMALTIPLELQAIHGYSPLLAGVAMLPGTVAALVMNPISGMMLDRHGPRGICLFGSSCLLVGTAAMLRLSHMESLWMVMLWQGVRAVGISSLIAPLTTWSVNALPLHSMPDGASVSNAFRQIAAAFGTSVAVLLMSQGANDAVVAIGVDGASWFAFATTVCMAAICLLFVRNRG